MEEIIQQRIKDTKKSLLENFDEEVVDKLKIRQSEDRDRVNSYNRHFWRLAKSVLKDSILASGTGGSNALLIIYSPRGCVTLN